MTQLSIKRPNTLQLSFQFLKTYNRLIRGPYSNFTNLTTQISVNNKYNIRNTNDIEFIESYKDMDMKFE